ncbi:MAG: hypothetical protein HKN32_08255 [Flavobacteriales bacterium]|nr:hypothetical protein [Flavobacteriales bacterium]
MRMKKFVLFITLFVSSLLTYAQPVPAEVENIPYLVTFGKDAARSWGDDDYCQIFFFSIPDDFNQPVYLRIFDPECGGEIDEMNEGFDTMTRFTVYGGDGCISNEDARETDPVGNYDSGNMLATKTFGSKLTYDNDWYTFGPFNPSEGEHTNKYGGNVFKLICEGIRGNDGNLYRYYMSTEPDRNVPVEGGNAFTFEYTFRLHSDPFQTSHIYPYIDEHVVSVMQSNFDWDSDGFIKIFSVTTLGESLSTSGDDEWKQGQYKVKPDELESSLDIQFTKDDKNLVNNNNVVFYVRNQYGELLPFYTAPIGGVPQPKGGKITFTPK